MRICLPSGFIKILQGWFSDEVNVPGSRSEGSPWITTPFWAGLPTAVPFSVSEEGEPSLSALFPIKDSTVQKPVRKGGIGDQLAILSQGFLSTLPSMTTGAQVTNKRLKFKFGAHEAQAGVCVCVCVLACSHSHVPLMWITMRLSIILELSMALFHLIKTGNWWPTHHKPSVRFGHHLAFHILIKSLLK